MQSELHTTYTMKPALQPRELTCRCMSGGCELVVRGAFAQNTLKGGARVE